MEKFDVFVFGTGSAGQKVAKKCAQHGLSVAIIDKREYGGVCSLRGCDPKKMMLSPIEAYESAQDMMQDGIDGDIRINWDEVKNRAEDYRSDKPRNTKEDLEEAGVTCLQGKAKFTSDHTIELDGKTIQADKFVIATGMKTIELDIPGEEYMATYEKFFELQEPPKEVVFAGAGYISMEFGNMLSRAGSNVTILEKDKHILSPFEPYVADKLEEVLTPGQLTIVKQADVSKVEKKENGYRVVYKKDDAEYYKDCDVVFNCTGRTPQIDQLGLEVIGVKTTKEGVDVDQHLKSTSHPHIYACGDVSSKHVPLTPLSSREAATVAASLTGEPEEIDINVIPSASFTCPQCASVGMTIDEAEKSDKNTHVIKKDLSDSFNNKRVNGTVYHFVLIIEDNTDKILGAHILGPKASEQINIFALAMTHGITMKQLESTVFTYPSWCNDILSLR